MKRIALACLLPALAASMPAEAAVFLFTQEGYSEGASASGSFTAFDLNDDGILNSLQGEVTDFSVAFSGNSIIGAFDLGLADLVGLYYSPTTFSIITSSTPQFLVNVGPGGSCTPVCSVLIDLPGIDFAIEAPTVTAVPEPATWAMMLLGFAVVGAAMRRRRLSVSYA